MPNAFVLAGGGSRGAYHIGAWQALSELEYKFDIVTGTSVGSLNGALVALGDLELAKSMWLSIGNRDVMDIPQKVLSPETLQFVRDVARQGGISLAPLEDMVTRFVDEEQVRASGVKYGLVTVNLTTREPMELTLEEIPQGKLVDYMMASSGCVPFLRPKIIDGQKFIDGGYYDNLPRSLAARMGATEIVEVDLESIGFDRPLGQEYSHVNIIRVCSWHDLGNFLEFDPAKAKRNMDLGYLDTYKAFGRLEGKAYAFKAGETDKMYADFGMRLMEKCEEIYSAHPAVKLAAELYLRTERKNPKTAGDKFLAVLEGAMEADALYEGEVYTAHSLAQQLKNTQPTPFAHIFGSEGEQNLLAKILATINAVDIKKLYLSIIKSLI